MLDKTTKEKIIKKFRTHEKDTGSPEVQIAILSEEIKLLADHLKSHKKDFSSRRGLLKKVSERRRLMRFLLRENIDGYEQIAKKLKLKPLKRALEIEEEIKTSEKATATA